MSDLKPLNSQIDTVVIAHTNGLSCKTEEECLLTARFLKNLYLGSRHMSDIPFNFLIGGDGRAYEISGWTKQSVRNEGV